MIELPAKLQDVVRDLTTQFIWKTMRIEFAKEFGVKMETQ
jgi:hypothetical protein